LTHSGVNETVSIPQIFTFEDKDKFAKYLLQCSKITLV